MLAILILFCVALTFCGFLMSIAYFLGPRSKNSSVKGAAYECGIPSLSSSSAPVPVKFFLTGILFIIFDIEIIFLYPFAIAYRDFMSSEQALPILFAVGFFLLLFVFGLWWEIKTKALDWK